MKKFTRFYKIFSFYCILLHFGFVAASPAATLKELEAVFLYNFSAYITWPKTHFDNSNGIFNICLLGEDAPLLQALSATVETEIKTESGHPLAIIEFDAKLAKKLVQRDAASLQQLSVCHILFLPIEIEDYVEVKGLVDVLAEQSVLTVSDMESFTEQCGMVRFEVSRGKRIALQVQYPRIERAKLQVSSALLEFVELNEDSYCGLP